MSSKRKVGFAIALVILCLGSRTVTQADTVTFNTRSAFNAATTGNTIVDFNGVASPGGATLLPSFTASGVAFTAPGNNLFIVDTGFHPAYQFAGASGGVLSPQSGSGALTTTLNIALGGAFTAIGFDVNNLTLSSSALIITATLSNGDITSFTTTPAGNFFGFTTSSSIVGLTLTAPQGADSVGFNIDNFTFGQASGGNGTAVPEPTTMLLLATGLVGVAAKVGRRRKVT